MKKTKKEKNDIIYCWKCGKKNPKKRWICYDEKCRARLKQKDHPIFYWLFGEIEGNLEDDFINFICQLIINFFKLHLYGATMGLAICFTAVATFSHYDDSNKIEATQKEYYITVNEEGNAVTVTDEVEETPEGVPEEVPEEKQEEEKKPTENKKEESKTESKKSCPSGYQMRSDGKCESIAYTDALALIECESGYNKVDSKGNVTSANTNVFCMSQVPYAGTSYCPSTRDDFISQYGNDECISASSSFTGSLNGSTCNYTFYGADGNQISCSNTYTYKYKCPEGDFFQSNQWCYEKKPTITNYYCLDKENGYVLTPDRKCRTVIEAN